MLNNKVTIFDTTLRDGQQSPGCGMSFDANVQYAHLAHQLGVDVLEAGFPSASQLDFDIVKTIASEMKRINSPMRIAGLCQLREAQVIKTIEALSVYRENATLHVYLPIDPNLMQASLGDRAQDKAGLIDDVAMLVHLAVGAGLKVEFSPEGYSNMGDTFDFVSDVIRAALANGASVINCPDTIGGACEWQGRDYIVTHMNEHAKLFAKEFPDKDITWSIHCHNDFGLALVNTMNAVFKGPARQIEGCINGVGERAGNTALEQCIMYIKKFGRLANPDHPFYTDCNTQKLQAISDFVSKHMMARQANWPIVGLNSARHSSGGHTNAVLRNPLSYQPFIPEEVGSKISMVFGPLSGGNHAKAIIEEAGFCCHDSEKAPIAQHIKDLFKERRKGLADHEVIAGYIHYFSPIKLDVLHYSQQDNKTSLHLSGTFFDETQVKVDQAESQSALHVLFNLILEKMPGLVLIDHHSRVEEGEANSLTVSRVQVKHDAVGWVTGEFKDNDQHIAAMSALIDAVNQLYVRQHRSK